MSTGPLVVSIGAIATDGGDGVVGDAAVFAELGCRAACVATGVLAASEDALHGFEAISEPLVALQLEAALTDSHPSGARIGVVAGVRQAALLAGLLPRGISEGAVYAPVVRASGKELLDRAELEAVGRALFPAVRAVVVRASDLSILAGREAEDIDGLRACASSLRARGARAVVIAGLLQRGRVVDLVDDDGHIALLDAARLQAAYVRGLAGAYAAALSVHLARGGILLNAAQAAQRYVGLRLSRGR